MTQNGTILVTGATGYVRARLVTRLPAKGYRLRETDPGTAELTRTAQFIADPSGKSVTR
jgi:uncharacterized protein YbjT (DUF2867 family)